MGQNGKKYDLGNFVHGRIVTVSGECSLVSTGGPLSPRCHSLLEQHSPQSLSALITVHCTQLFPITIVMFCVYKYPAYLVFV